MPPFPWPREIRLAYGIDCTRSRVDSGECAQSIPYANRIATNDYGTALKGASASSSQTIHNGSDYEEALAPLRAVP